MTHNVNPVPLTRGEVAMLQATKLDRGIEYSYTYDEACEAVPALLDDETARWVDDLNGGLSILGFDLDDPESVTPEYRPALAAALLGATRSADPDDVLTAAFEHLCPAEVPGQLAFRGILR